MLSEMRQNVSSSVYNDRKTVIEFCFLVDLSSISVAVYVGSAGSADPTDPVQCVNHKEVDHRV